LREDLPMPAKPPSSVARPRGRPKGSRNRLKLTAHVAEASAHPVLTMRYDVASASSGLSQSYLKKLVHDGRLQSTTVGRTRLIWVDSLRKLLGLEGA
jgi:hypothetical protein